MTKYHKNMSILLFYFLFLVLLIGWAVNGIAVNGQIDEHMKTSDSEQSEAGVIVYRLPAKQGKRHGME